jgi:predicted deacylase
MNPIVIVSGIHGDEPAGNIAAKYFEGKDDVIVLSDINQTGKRRLGSQDLNRHFDQDGQDLQNSILSYIESLNPQLVISLHEDDNARGVYVYCSSNISDQIKKILLKYNLPLAKSAYGDKTDNGVIDNGNQPYRGTLERALEKRNIPYCTIETPLHLDLGQRVNIFKKLVSELI